MREETKMRFMGRVIVRAATWVMRKIREARVRHQRREALRTLTRKSEPTPREVSQYQIGEREVCIYHLEDDRRSCILRGWRRASPGAS